MPPDTAPLLRTRQPAPKSREELTADAAHLEALILAFENARLVAEAYRAAMDDGDRLQRSVQGAADAASDALADLRGDLAGVKRRLAEMDAKSDAGERLADFNWLMGRVL